MTNSLLSIQKLKKQEKISYYRTKGTKEDVMKQKQFGPLDIIITRRKMQVHTVKKWRGGQIKSIGRRLVLANWAAKCYYFKIEECISLIFCIYACQKM